MDDRAQATRDNQQIAAELALAAEYIAANADRLPSLRYGINLGAWCYTIDQVVQAISSPGTWEKSYDSGTGSAIRHIGEYVKINAWWSRALTCERKQVGTRHVEATPAHDVPVYTWDCGSILATTDSKGE